MYLFINQAIVEENAARSYLAPAHNASYPPFQKKKNHLHRYSIGTAEKTFVGMLARVTISQGAKEDVKTFR